MASIKKRGKGWRAMVKVNGHRDSATFDIKTEAKAWAAARETELADAPPGDRHDDTRLSDLFARYAREVSPHHKGARWEQLRLELYSRQIGHYTVGDLFDSDVISNWKTQRLRTVKPGTVIRDMGVINQVFATAHTEWRLITRNPLQGIKKPKKPRPRDRVISPEELATIKQALKYDADCAVELKKQQVGLALDIALETAMRASEVLQLTNEYKDRKVFVLVSTKNGDRREVPLSKKAREHIARIPDGGFTVTPGVLSTMFRKARDKCRFPTGQAGGFTFHDSRANALTMLSQKVDVLALAKIVGHRDPRSLMIYYRKSAEDIADSL